LEYRWTIKDLPPDLRPREKMEKMGPEALTDAELLAILLGTGSKYESALELAHRILAQPKGLRFLAEASLHDLLQIPWVGLAKACQVKAAVELGRRLALEAGEVRPAIKTPQDVVALLMEKMRYLDREHFVVLHLDTKHQVLATETVSIGSLNSTVVHPRELFKTAIRRSAAAVILAHNHPSGDPAPSPEDLSITARLVEAGRILGIEVLDHVIIGDGRYFSFKKEGKI